MERSGHVPVPYADRLAPTNGFTAPAATAPPRGTHGIRAVGGAPVAAKPAEPAEPTAPGGDDVLAVDRIVAEMTGYPADLLDPDLDL